MEKERDSSKEEWMEFIEMFLPFLQKEGLPIDPIVYEAAEMFHIHNADDFFKRKKEAAKKLAQIIYAVSNGIKPNGQEIPPQKFIEAASALVAADLTQAEMKQAADEVRGSAKGQSAEAGPVGMRG